jgi:hypothetical protein
MKGGGRVTPTNAILFVFGTNGVWTTSSSKINILRLGTCQVFTMQNQEGKLHFDIDLFDGTNLVARIRDNEFHLVAAQYAYTDRSNDRSMIGIYDKSGKEVLYIHYLNPFAVTVRGTFSCSDGTEAIVTDEKFSTVVMGSRLQFAGNCRRAVDSRGGVEIDAHSLGW